MAKMNRMQILNSAADAVEKKYKKKPASDDVAHEKGESSEFKAGEAEGEAEVGKGKKVPAFFKKGKK